MSLKKIILSSFLFSLISCSGSGEFEIIGTVNSINYVGFNCWYIVDSRNNYYYELVTDDELLFRKGLKVKMRAKKSNSETICKVGDRIDVLGYTIIKDVEKPKEEIY
ncbi:MAG: hypothetical protein KatS3mg068_2405 [Candidatus Sericytochromatia bacterium]|nr:MAG: hypothetical protein KatS3mg068_2405 [Candidatus Sericytochromatia bacterium]